MSLRKFSQFSGISGKRLLSVFLLAVVVLGSLHAQISKTKEALPLQAFPGDLSFLSSPVIILADAGSGTILFERGSGIAVPPASLVKLMTLHLSLMDVENGSLNQHLNYLIPAEGAAANMRWGSSVLGLRKGDSVSLLTLMRAAGIASGNDAAWSLALLSSNGDAESFIGRMNQMAIKLGMMNTLYFDPDGWSSLSETTGMDQMRLVLTYLTSHPLALMSIHSLQSMVYMPTDTMSAKPRKRNTNLLLGTYPGADGLKTGAIPGEVFNFIATAERDGTRLIALIMGLKSEDYFVGIKTRASEAAAVLDWGFWNYETWRHSPVVMPDIYVRHGQERSLPIRMAAEGNPVSIRRVDSSEVRTLVDIPDSLAAPVQEGEVIGRVKWSIGNEVILEIPLIAAESVQKRWRLTDFLGIEKVPE